MPPFYSNDSLKGPVSEELSFVQKRAKDLFSRGLDMGGALIQHKIRHAALIILEKFNLCIHYLEEEFCLALRENLDFALACGL